MEYSQIVYVFKKNIYQASTALENYNYFKVIQLM